MIEFNLLVFLLFAVVLEIAFAIFRPLSFIIMAGPAGLEPAAPGFGDQCIEPRTCVKNVAYFTTALTLMQGLRLYK